MDMSTIPSNVSPEVATSFLDFIEKVAMKSDDGLAEVLTNIRTCIEVMSGLRSVNTSGAGSCPDWWAMATAAAVLAEDAMSVGADGASRFFLDVHEAASQHIQDGVLPETSSA